MYYIGEDFLGDINDVATEAFWKNRQADLVKRVLPMAYTSLSYFDAYYDGWKHEYYISPNLITLWLGGSVSNTSTIINGYRIPYKTAPSFVFSGNQEGKAFLETFGGIATLGGVDVGRSVRLFSDK